MRGEGEGGGGWVVAGGGTGEIDKVTTQREAKQAAAAQTSTRWGAIGYRLLVLRTAFHVGALGRRKKRAAGVQETCMCACTYECASRSAGVEECARFPKSHGVGPSVMDAQLDTDINRDAMQPPHDMYRVLFKKKNVLNILSVFLGCLLQVRCCLSYRP